MPIDANLSLATGRNLGFLSPMSILKPPATFQLKFQSKQISKDREVSFKHFQAKKKMNQKLRDEVYAVRKDNKFIKKKWQQEQDSK